MNPIRKSSFTILPNSYQIKFLLSSCSCIGFYFILFIFRELSCCTSSDTTDERGNCQKFLLVHLISWWKLNERITRFLQQQPSRLRRQQNKLKHLVAKSDQVRGLLQVLKCSESYRKKHRKNFVGNLHNSAVDPKFVKTAEIILINVKAGKVNRRYWWIQEMQIDKAAGTLRIWRLRHSRLDSNSVNTSLYLISMQTRSRSSIFTVQLRETRSKHIKCCAAAPAQSPDFPIKKLKSRNVF